MKTLILMRHAKSDWSTGEESDHARPLNRRGRASALALGNWLRGKGWLPDQVLCSTARRTRETLAGLGLEVEADYRDALYHAEVEALLEAVRGATGGTVLIIGHNPGIGELAERLVAEAPEHREFYNYPTGATLVVRFGVDGWPEVGERTGEAVDFVVPRELV
ncbi:MAG: histidine phosphatase family protein [Pseudooceanicola sp.]|nr:histidine phosphatase family protein [Pseudooceanicola sp.]